LYDSEEEAVAAFNEMQPRDEAHNEDCDCDKLPVFDMDGSYFDGVCRKCEARMTEAGYDKLANGWIG
jgi:hypothetical protein